MAALLGGVASACAVLLSHVLLAIPVGRNHNMHLHEEFMKRFSPFSVRLDAGRSSCVSPQICAEFRLRCAVSKGSSVFALKRDDP